MIIDLVLSACVAWYAWAGIRWTLRTHQDRLDEAELWRQCAERGETVHDYYWRMLHAHAAEKMRVLGIRAWGPHRRPDA